MKRFCCSLLLFLLVSVFTSSPALADWQIVWQDEFNGNRLDTNQWEYETGGGGWGNDELEFYTANRTENVRVQNGNLVIEARPENYGNREFTSGRIHSKQGWTYGKFESRARLAKGHNLWPAIWMFPRDSHYGPWAASGEIDIMEYRGDNVHQICGTIHYGGTWPDNTASGSGDINFEMDFSADYHVFAVEWDPKSIRWYVDHKEFHRENIDRMMWSGRGKNPYNKNGQPFDQPFRWILNVAVGGKFFGPGPYVTPREAQNWPKHTMEVDYVRVYQWK